MNRGYRFLMAVMMLALYAVVSLASDVVSLTCDCHHSLCVHSLEHTPSHNHCDCGGGCEHESVAMSCQGCAPQFNCQGCCCNHSHSTDILLYTQPRGAEDDALMRYALSLVQAVPLSDTYEINIEGDSSPSFNGYLLPPLLAAHKAGIGLRAPPSLV